MVLVIENDRDTANSLREVLECEGFQVAVAYGAAEGIAKAQELAPKVVLCDLGMPDVDGYAVGRALRADPRTAGAYLVALSGYAAQDDVRQARRAGFDLHVAKPSDPSQIVRLVRGARKSAVPDPGLEGGGAS